VVRTHQMLWRKNSVNLKSELYGKYVCGDIYDICEQPPLSRYPSRDIIVSNEEDRVGESDPSREIGCY
jgi:hypothetical protein